MIRKKFLAAVLLAFLGTGAPGAAAAYSTGTDYDKIREIAAQRGAGIPLSTAIRTVETAGRGHAFAAGAGEDGGRVYYLIKTAGDAGIREWQVELATGKVLEVASEYDNERDQRTAGGLAAVKTSLVEAIRAAERRVGGKALKAEYEHKNEGTVVEVEVFSPKGAAPTRVTVDTLTGKVLFVRDLDHEDG